MHVVSPAERTGSGPRARRVDVAEGGDGGSRAEVGARVGAQIRRG